jgi:hypothetical protein
MQGIVLDLNKTICEAGTTAIGTKIQFSLRPFIDFLQQKISDEKTAKVNFYNYLLEQFSAFPELIYPISNQDTTKYNHIFELIYTALSPIINDEREQLWALGSPITPCFYYGTDAFYNVLLNKDKTLKDSISLPSTAEMETKMLRNFYHLVLQKFYNINLSSNQHLVHSIVDHQTHLQRYYRLNVDNRFLNITTSGELPELSKDGLQEYMKDESTSIQTLKTLIPPHLFNIEGISIVNLTDVTGEYALESIKNTIIDHNQCQEDWSSDTIVTALKSLVGSDAVEFGLLPYIQLNNKTLLYSHEGFESVVIKQAKLQGMAEEEYDQLVSDFVTHPRRLIFPDIKIDAYTDFPILRLIDEQGVKSYALFPLYYNAKLVGCLEMYAKDSSVFNGNTFSMIEAAFPLLSQLYSNIIVDFNNEIMSIVTNKFTGLQPAVQWSFYQAAYQYLKSGDWEKDLPIDTVYFKDVHPLYGAIDIKNSSIERNLVIRKDLYTHFEVLEAMLQNLKVKIPQDFESGLPHKRSVWDHKGFDELSDREIMKTDDYLQRQLPPYLIAIKESHPETALIIDEYFELTKPGGGIFQNRENYELSMQMINHAATRRLDEFNSQLQELYPCYFEKFRTDGVEFDIYLGQSITPDRKFDEALVADFRYRQLKVIAEIAQVTAGLTSHLPIPLETTQLIFVYGKVLNISFRIDEQRFDVDGSYNIRYQMVKKRIDKAHVKDSTERITQPGKITIVYFHSEESREYMQYINILQDENLLSNAVEYIDVEELQGVEGLKALRVEVVKQTV